MIGARVFAAKVPNEYVLRMNTPKRNKFFLYEFRIDGKEISCESINLPGGDMMEEMVTSSFLATLARFSIAQNVCLNDQALWHHMTVNCPQGLEVI